MSIVEVSCIVLVSGRVPQLFSGDPGFVVTVESTMTESPFDALVEAFRDAKAQMTEATRMVKADIVAPADPNARQLTREERRAEYEDIIGNPARLESEFMRLKERHKLTDEKPIPRRLVDYIRREYKAYRNDAD